jgi:hypothetical protein
MGVSLWSIRWEKKMANEKPLGMMLSPYEQGEWDMFNLITSVEYGKQYYFLEKNGMVYSRESHEYMTREQAYEEFLKRWEH